MRSNFKFVIAALAAVSFGIATLPALHAQPLPSQPTARLATSDDRKNVLEALEKRDFAGAEKLIGELQKQLVAVPPIVTPPIPVPVPIPLPGPFPIGGSVAFEEIKACGFYPQETRLACVIEIKRPTGYSGPVGSFGSVEHVYFCVDWNGNGAFTQMESAGQGSVQMHDESAHAQGPWQYVVYRDFNPFGGFRTLNNGTSAPTSTNAPSVRVKAILSWFAAPTGCNYLPVWGNIVLFQIRMDPIR